MGRKHTSGSVGNQGVGGVQVDNTTLTSADNLDITIVPAGTGLFKVDGDAQIESQGDLRFGDSDNSNWVALQAPTTVASNVTWTLPAADGTNQQVLTTNGVGSLSFTSKSLPLTDDTVAASTNYILFSSASTGDLTTLRTATTKITFVPSDGQLAVEGTVRSLSQENVKTGNHTLALEDRSKVVAMNNSSSATVTIPTDSVTDFPIGSEVRITRIGTGSVTLSAPGVTVNAGGTGNLASGETIVARKRAANSWIVFHRPYSVTGTGGSTSTVGTVNVHTYTSTGASSFVVGT